jgi:uncharacterized lipoprotein NlpE involved in copper resistance
MKKDIAINKIFLSILLSILIIGCNNQEDKKTAEKKTAEKKTQVTKVSMNSFNQSAAHQAEKNILAMEEITEVKAVNSDKELYVAAKPEQHERFQLNRLKKEMKQKLQDTYPNLKIYVSVDRKILMMLEQLGNKIKDGKADKKTIKKKLKKIKSDMNSDI